MEFLEELKTELEFDQVFVFTPKGEVKKLPLGSTPVDFAYAVHTELGNQCMGAKVNDKMVRLDTALKSGDRCQILVRKGQRPNKDWLLFVKTPRARSKIRKFFRENQG
jgi:GTP pyrophosphokinase